MRTVCRWKSRQSVNACLPMITEMKRVDICWNGDQDTLDAVDATLKAYDNQNSDESSGKKMLKVYADEYNTSFPKWTQKTLPSTEQSAVVRGYQTVVTKKMWIMWLMDLRHLRGRLSGADGCTWFDRSRFLSRLPWERQWKVWRQHDTCILHLYKGQYAAIDIIPENDVSFEVQFSAVTRECRTRSSLQMMKVVEVQGNEGSVETITTQRRPWKTVTQSQHIWQQFWQRVSQWNGKNMMKNLIIFAGNLAVDKNSMVITIDWSRKCFWRCER